MRCIEWGGPVLTMTSTGFSSRYFFRKRTDGLTQVTLGSGMNRLPRSMSISFCLKVLSRLLMGFTSFTLPSLRPISRR